LEEIMGREVKRVPLDFDWPLDKVWRGFLNDRPGADKCAVCDGSGSSPEAIALKNKWYGYAPFTPEENGSVPLTIQHPAVRQFATKNTFQMVFTSIYGFDEGIDKYWKNFKSGTLDSYLNIYPEIEQYIDKEATRLIDMWNGQWSHHLNADDVQALLDDNRLSDFTRYPRTEEQKAEYERIEAANNANRANPVEGYKYVWFNNGYVPTPQEVNDWSITSFGHDCINQWVCTNARCKKMGVSNKCSACDGHGEIWQSEEARVYYEAWQREEPPTGDGWQLWETVSEGSPITPVFATPEELARYQTNPGNDTSTTKGTTFEQWMAFISVGWAPSMIGNGDTIQDGVAAVADEVIKKEKHESLCLPPG
jgi:hypothetical protein